MAFGGKQRTSTPYLYTGLVDATVKFINPTLEQIQEINPSADKEPDYTKASKDGVDQIRVDIIYEVTYTPENGEPVTIYPRESIYVQDKVQASTKTPGSTAWLNDKGQSKWAVDINSITEDQKKWFDLDANPRRAMVGEVDLYDFLSAWANVDQRAEDAQMKLETAIEDVVHGDVEELQNLQNIPPFKGRQVRVLLGVRSDDKGGNYQDVYSRVHMAAGQTNTKRLSKAVFDKAYPWKSDFQGSFKFQPYDPLAPTAVVEAMPVAAAQRKI